MKKYKYLKFERRDNIAHISLHRPKQNRINIALLRELNAVLSKLVTDQDLAGVVITGTGQFSAGYDLAELLKLNYSNAKKFSSIGQETLLLLNKIDKPVIAAIDGPAIGPGMELALACDIRLATDAAILHYPEMSMGLIPCFGGTVRLQKIVGQRQATDLLNSSRKLTANEALKLGIVDSLVDSKSMLFEAEQLIRTEHIEKESMSSEDFSEEREAFARCFKDEDIKRLIRKGMR
ncbi:MAG: enoyl-CoA hydratase/isomerase family protein [Nanoarchaeota archaeon]